MNGLVPVWMDVWRLHVEWKECIFLTLVHSRPLGQVFLSSCNGLCRQSRRGQERNRDWNAWAQGNGGTLGKAPPGRKVRMRACGMVGG